MQKATVLPLSYYLYQLLAGTCQLIYILQRFRAVRGTFRRIFLVFLHAPVNLTTILRRFCQTDVLTVALPLIYCLPWPAVMHSCLPLWIQMWRQKKARDIIHKTTDLSLVYFMWSHVFFPGVILGIFPVIFTRGFKPLSKSLAKGNVSCSAKPWQYTAPKVQVLGKEEVLKM